MKKFTKLILALVMVLTITSLPQVTSNAASNTSKATAIDLPVNTETTLNFDQDDTTYYYKFKAVNYCNYYDLTVKNLKDDTYGITVSVVDEDGGKIRDSFSVNKSETELVRFKTVPNQIYYVKVSSGFKASGSAKLTLKAYSDVADTKATATPYTLGSKKSEMICSSDVDYYKFTAPNYDNYIQFKATVSSDTSSSLNFQILNTEEAKELSISISAGSSKTYNVKLEKGKTYYIKVMESWYYGSAPYTIQTTVVKDVADTRASAGTIALNKKVSETLCVDDDQDYYKFKAPNYASYMTLKTNVTSSSNYGAYFDVLDSNGGNVLTNTWTSSGNSNTYTVKLQPNATYYVHVYNNYSTSSYSFETKVYNDEPDTKSSAKAIDYNKRVSASIASGKDEDWFKFYVPVKQHIILDLTKTSDSGSNVYTAIYNEAGEQMTYAYASNGNKVTAKKLVEPGMYYIKAYSGSSGNSNLSGYSFNLNYAPIVERLEYDDWYGRWYYTIDGEVDYSKTGLVFDPVVGWWYVKDGKIDFECNDLIFDPVFGWWKINNGMVDFGYNDLFFSPSLQSWWKVAGGTIDFGYNDLFFSPGLNSWWKITNGYIDFGYNDLFFSPGLQSWWKITNGYIDFWYNDLFFSPGLQSWWKVAGGTIDFGYYGAYYSPGLNSWWNISGGMLVF